MSTAASAPGGRPGRLQDRFALVTGGTRGIGRAVAEAFAREGATVAINDRHADPADGAVVDTLKAISRAAGHGERDHRLVPADVSDAAQVDAMVGDCVSAWGRLDILVNNAGIQAETPGDAFDEAVLSKIMAVDLTGPALCARAAIRHFLARPGGGAIINTSSVHQIIPKPGYLAYAMAKSGLGHLTRTLALEFADKGIRVNAVGPGATITEMNAAWADDPKAKAGVERHIPMGFAAAASDMAGAYVFLASDEARYVTGQTIFVCGGLTLYGEFKENWSS